MSDKLNESLSENPGASIDSNNSTDMEDMRPNSLVADGTRMDECSEKVQIQEEDEEELSRIFSEIKVAPSSPERAVFKSKGAASTIFEKPNFTAEQTDDSNITPMRGCVESSSNSHYYSIPRTMSSPCMIDASPKPRQVMSPAMPTITSPTSMERNEQGQVIVLSPERRLNLHLDLASNAMIDLTPVIRNTVDNEEHRLEFVDSKIIKGVNLESLSVPETKSFTSVQSSRNNLKSTSQVIRPRLSTSSGMHYSSRLRNKGSLPRLEPSSSGSPGLRHHSSPANILTKDMRPASPPTFSSHRSSASSVWMGRRRVKSASEKVFKNRPSPLLSDRKKGSDDNNNNMPTSQPSSRSVRYSSPLSSEIQLDRNCFSFAGTSEFERKRLLSTQKSDSKNNQLPKGSPEVTSPPDEFNWNLLKPYQPSRNFSLTSFGLEDDLDAIFLRPRLDSSSIIDEEGEGNGNGEYSFSRRTMTNKSGDQISIPSIGLAHNFSSTSSTQDSFMTNDEYYYDEHEEDSIVMLPRPAAVGRIDVIGGRYNAENCGQLSVESEHINLEGGRQVLNELRDGEIRLSSSRGAKQEQSAGQADEIHDIEKDRICSPKKAREAAREKRVYQWLKTLEVDKDNNDYVAEAASSKFLTGKNISPRTVATLLQNGTTTSGNVTSNGNIPYGTLPDEPDPTISTSGSGQEIETARALSSCSSISLLTNQSSTLDIQVARPIVTSDSCSTVTSPSNNAKSPTVSTKPASTRLRGRREVCGRNLSSWGGRKRGSGNKRLSASSYRVG